MGSSSNSQFLGQRSLQRRRSRDLGTGSSEPERSVISNRRILFESRTCDNDGRHSTTNPHRDHIRLAIEPSRSADLPGKAGK